MIFLKSLVVSCKGDAWERLCMGSLSEIDMPYIRQNRVNAKKYFFALLSSPLNIQLLLL